MTQKFPIFDGIVYIWIPWSVLAPHEKQAQLNHGQSLERLAERRGLCPSEAIAVIEDRKWTSMPHSEARARLKELVEQSSVGATP